MALARFADVIVPVTLCGSTALSRLRDILECSGPALRRLLIVDDGCADRTLAQGFLDLAAADGRVHHLRCSRGLSWSEYANRALSECDGDVVLLTPDALPTPGWIEPLAEAAHSEERVALACPLSNGDGFESPLDMDHERIRKAISGLPEDTFTPRSGLVCNYLRSDVLAAVGLLDSSFKSARDAVDDWLMRACSLGFFAKRAPRSLVFSIDPTSDGESGGSTSVEGGDELLKRHVYMKGQVDRVGRSLDESLASHAIDFETNGRIRVALDLRHIPLEVNGTKIYAISLAKALTAMDDVDLTLLANHPLQADGVDAPIVSPEDWRDDVAILHKPAQIFDRSHAKLLFESRAHVVMTYQDLIAYRMAHVFADEAEYNAYQKTTRLILPAVQGILTYSENTAREVELEFGVGREAIHPVFLGVDFEDFATRVSPQTSEEVLSRLGLGPEESYLLSLASDLPHKNLAGLLEAYRIFRNWWTDGEPPRLVLAGRAPRVELEYRERSDGPIPGVVFLGPVAHEELRVLYQNAHSLVFPSLYEGFGLPPLEAMAAGTPVVAMPFSSVPEVCSAGAFYSEGLSPVDLARAMQRLNDEQDLRTELREKGLQRARELSWVRTAKETVDVYRKVLLNPSPQTLLGRRALGEAITLWSTDYKPTPASGGIQESVDALEPINAPEPEPTVIYLPAPVLEPEPLGMIESCRALRQAVKRRLKRDLGRKSATQWARLVKVKRLSSRFIQVARADGLGVASVKASRKARNKARQILRRVRFRLWNAGSGCAYFQPPASVDPYLAWQEVNGSSTYRAERLREAIDAIAEPTMFSLIVPIYNTPPQLLDQAVQSVLTQTYERWELILADDASGDPALESYLNDGLSRDPRVKLVRRKVNGNISAATNTAAEHATGDFFVLLDHDDLLHHDALAHLALAIEAHSEVDMLYSDEDKLGTDGARCSPQFKPDWSPELLLSFCYTGHVSAVRATLYREVNGMRLGFEGSQDHDFWLRASERARKIVHIPQVLYHWRVIPGSTAASGHEKPHSFEAGRRAVEEAFVRRGVLCHVQQPEWARAAGCGVFQPVMPDEGPSVAILIATKNQKTLLQNLLNSLEATSYRNYRVYVIDNESDDPETLDYLAQIRHTVLHIPNLDGRFNYAAVHNAAVARVEEDMLLFLNNDVEVVEPRWLSQMVGWAMLPGVGSVGAKLLYADRRVQHAGIVHGLHEGLAGHAFKLLPWWDGGAMGLARATRNCLAVTAACMLTPRSLFQSMNGFDEIDFGVAYNDADYGYRLHDAGYRNVICAEAELLHYEGATRGFGDNPREEASYRRRHGDRVDPYFNLHLDARSETFELQPTVVPIAPKDRPVRLLAVSHNLNWEGASRFELEMTTGLKATGAAEPIVVSPVDGPLREEYEKAGVDVRIDPALVSLFGGEAAYVESRAKSVELLHREGIEVLHANTLQGFWAVDAAREAGVPSVWSIHESEAWQTYFDQFPQPIARVALGCMETPYRVVFTAQSSSDVWQDLNTRGNFGLVRYALNVERFQAEVTAASREDARNSLGLGDDETCILLLGTVCERKGQHDLVHAFRSLSPDAVAKLRCVVVGARDSLEYSRELRQLVQALPDDRRSRFQIIDETGETAPYWQAADVFCCTSRVESYPHVVQEAMGRGLPIVSTSVFGIPEQVRHDVNALFYTPGDARALAKHLTVLANDPARRRRMGDASSWVLRALPNHADMIVQYGAILRSAAESAVLGDPSHLSTGSAVVSTSRRWFSDGQHAGSPGNSSQSERVG